MRILRKRTVSRDVVFSVKRLWVLLNWTFDELIDLNCVQIVMGAPQPFLKRRMMMMMMWMMQKLRMWVMIMMTQLMQPMMHVYFACVAC